MDKDENEYDRIIKQFQKEKAEAIQAKKDKKRRDMRRALWLGKIVPILCFLCLIISGLILFGK